MGQGIPAVAVGIGRDGVNAPKTLGGVKIHEISARRGSRQAEKKKAKHKQNVT
jgi:hypothetical protein